MCRIYEFVQNEFFAINFIAPFAYIDFLNISHLGIGGFVPEKIWHTYIWNRVANIHGKRHCNIGLDLVNEHMNLDFKGKNIMISTILYISFKLCLIDVKQTSFIRNDIPDFFIMRYVVLPMYNTAKWTSYISNLQKRNLMSIINKT